MYDDLGMLNMEFADGIAPVFWCQTIGNVVDERLHVLGETEDAGRTQRLPPTPFRNLSEESVYVLTGDL